MNNLTQQSLRNSVAKPKSTPKQKFIYFVVTTVIMFTVATLIVTSDPEKLEDYTAYEGKLSELTITSTRRDMGQPSTPIMVFTVEGLDSKLGIGQNAPADFSIYTNKLKVGDKVKVYYDSHPFLTPEGYNPFVLQLEKDGIVLLDINEKNRSYKKGGYIGLGLGVLALIGTIIYYRNNVGKKIE